MASTRRRFSRKGFLRMQSRRKAMQVVYGRCAGLDVHKKTVSACITVCEGKRVKQQQTRTFGTFTQDLLMLSNWLKEHGVTHVAMEATGVYWRPIWAVLEGQ